jgi:antitoxin CptB
MMNAVDNTEAVNIADRDIERLKWKSRRGLLELDLFFTKFWQQEQLALNEEDKVVLSRLLDFPDNDILDLFMARKTSDDRSVQKLVDRVKML